MFSSKDVIEAEMSLLRERTSVQERWQLVAAGKSTVTSKGGETLQLYAEDGQDSFAGCLLSAERHRHCDYSRNYTKVIFILSNSFCNFEAASNLCLASRFMRSSYTWRNQRACDITLMVCVEVAGERE